MSSDALSTCPVPVASVEPAAIVLHPDPQADGWSDLARWLAPDTPDKAIGPLCHVLDVARRHGCRTIVVELRYLDPDYRSEYAAFWSKRFETRNPVARRMHFFTGRIEVDVLHDLPDEATASYVGYSVLRPALLGPVGRSVLAAPPGLEGAKLCQVRDRPSLFGSSLEVTGVPFAQQDGELLICAHTAAWLCHYVAHDRGIIGRRSTADIVATPSAEGSRRRPVPSAGLTSEQLQGVFSTLGIPAFFYDLADLPDLPAEPEREPARKDESVKAADQRHRRRLLRERLLRVVCKYLNSGFPVIVLTENGSAHAYTLVGWRENEDGEITLLASDDQVGPYEEIRDPFSDTPAHRGHPKSVMIPLPEKVFLTGEAAETGAFGLVDVVGSQYAELDNPAVEGAQANDLSRIMAVLRRWRGPVSVRTRLLAGRRYKTLLQRQARSPAVLRLMRLSHLPHWVWLVEFHDREAREAGKPCVLAEVVFDSTSHDDIPIVDLVATTSIAVDAGLERAHPNAEEVKADGDGDMWRSMISDAELIDDEYLIVQRRNDAGGGARRAA